MTFYEAALRILEEAGSPLHSLEITKRSLDQGLLSHVGKTPEVTMLSRLAAMAKRSRERKLMVTARDTFALTDWMLPEDETALAATGVPEVNPEEDLPPMRAVERHPEPRAEYLRSIGRQAERKRRGDDDGRRKKFPPTAEVAFELLGESGTALVPSELLARMKSRELVADDLGIGALLEALAADNQQRLDQGRRPQFAALRAESGELQLSVESAQQIEDGPGPLELQQAFCAAAQLPFENGRVVLRSQRREATAEGGTGVAVSPEDAALAQTAKSAVRDARRAMARVFRRKLLDLDAPTFEKACVRLLHGLHFRELKVARRSKEGPLLTARRKDGSLELRYAIRVVKNGSTERRSVQDLRRDLNHHGAQLGLILSAGDCRGDARSEATSGGALVLLWCGDALAEKFFEAQVGVKVTQVELFDVDEQFFVQTKLDAEESTKRREERSRERHGDRDRNAQDARASSPNAEAPISDTAPTPPAASPGGSGGVSAAPAPEHVLDAPAGEDGEEGDDEGPDEAGDEAEAGASATPGAPSAPGEGGRRRRRRRRRRRGGGGGQPGQPGQPGAPGASAAASGGDAGQGSAEGGGGGGGGGESAPSAPQAPAAPAPSSGNGES